MTGSPCLLVEWCGDDDNLIFTSSDRPGEVNKVKRYSLRNDDIETILIEKDSR